MPEFEAGCGQFRIGSTRTFEYQAAHFPKYGADGECRNMRDEKGLV